MKSIPIREACVCDTPGLRLDVGALYELANKIGLAAIEMDRAVKSGEEECAHQAVGQMRLASNVMNAIASHVEGKIALHRRRTTGIR